MSDKKPRPETQEKPQTAKSAKDTPPHEAAKKTTDETTESEVGGYKDQGLLEPTRFGDWEVKGRCSDF